MNENLKRFLLALNIIKGMKDEDGSPYACFGGYRPGDRLACHRSITTDKVCRVCYRMATIASDDWIDDELAKLK